METVRAMLAAALSEKPTTPDEPGRDESLAKFDEIFGGAINKSEDRGPRLKHRTVSYEEVEGGYLKHTTRTEVDPTNGDKMVAESTEPVAPEQEHEAQAWVERIEAERSQAAEQSTGRGA